jgi:hypothetical protein
MADVPLPLPGKTTLNLSPAAVYPSKRGVGNFHGDEAC